MRLTKTMLGVLAGMAIAWQVANGQCANPPVTQVTCPCSGNPVTDNTSVGAGVWCYNGGEPDGVINGLYLNDPNGTVIICSDVSLRSTYINNGWLIIGPGVNVVYNNTWSSSMVDGGIVNFGSLVLGSDFTLSPNGKIFNYGRLVAAGLTTTGQSQIIVGPDASMTVDNLDVQTSCSVCFEQGPSFIVVDTFTVGGGLTAATCTEGGNVCVQITTPEVIVNSTLANDPNNTIYYCVPDQATLNYITSTGFVGTATVDICQCNLVLDNGYITLNISDVDESSLILSWTTHGAQNPLQYVIYRVNGEVAEIVGTTVRTSAIIERPDEQSVFMVAGLLPSGEMIYSNKVIYNPEELVGKPTEPIIVTPEATIICSDPICYVAVYSAVGKKVSEFILSQGKYAVSSLLGNLPEHVYVIHPIEGNVSVISSMEPHNTAGF